MNKPMIIVQVTQEGPENWFFAVSKHAPSFVLCAPDVESLDKQVRATVDAMMPRGATIFSNVSDFLEVPHVA